MIFIETEVFTEDVKKLLDDHDYAKFQTFLALQPDYGDVIPDTGDCGKCVGHHRERASAVV
jgi:hypothetical protein